jgi:hypothetical protein
MPSKLLGIRRERRIWKQCEVEFISRVDMPCRVD